METSVIVVHGVGDPLPGNALEKLTQGLTAAGWRVDEPPRIEHPLEGAEGTPPFPVARAGVGSADGRHTLRIREVYWGDLSRPKASLFGLVSALFDLIFGLRYIVTAAANQLGGSAYAGAQLARAALWWARGPMFALNIIAAAVCLTYVVLLSVPSPFGDDPPLSAPVTAVLLGSLLVAGAGWVVRRRAKELHWSPATGDAMMALAPLAAWAGWAMRSRLEHDLGAFIGGAASSTHGVTDAMVIGALVMALTALASLILCGLGAFSAPNRKPLIVVTFCTSLALGLFTFVVVALWVAIGRTIREDTAGRVDRCLRTARDVLQGCLDSKVDATAGTLIADRVEAGIHLLPWVVFGFVGMALCFLLVMFGNWFRAQRKSKRRFRYIVSPLVVAAGVTVSAAYGIFFVVLAWSLLFGGIELPSGLLAAELKPFALTLTVAIAGAVVATRSQFLAALDLVLDVIAHFRTEGEGLLGRDGKHVVWERVIARFQRVLDDELARSNRGVVVVSHSQGTTIAAHALGALTVKGLDVTPNPCAQQRVWLVTMGSPIEYLYQEYMPSRYGVVPSAVARWRHLYRVDDFIGTTIKGLGGHGGEEIGTGGHADYWSDPKVVPRIIDSVREAEAHDSAPSKRCVRPPPMTFVHRDDDGSAFEVVRRGDRGPAVMLLHEVLGMTPECIAFADRIAASGFSVYLPLFFGRPGRRAGVASIARFCVRREIVAMSLSVQSSNQGPVSNWLRSLAARLHADPQHRADAGVGVIGMCLTGRFVLSTMLAFPAVRAGVMCQPATPAPVGDARRSASGVSDADLDELKRKLPTDGPSILGVAFANDAVSPARRLHELEHRLGPCFKAISLRSGGPRQPPRSAHSVFTGGYPAESCADIEAALRDVTAMLRHRLGQADAASDAAGVP